MLNHRRISARTPSLAASSSTSYQSQSSPPLHERNETSQTFNYKNVPESSDSLSSVPLKVVPNSATIKSVNSTSKVSTMANPSSSAIAEFDSLRREATKLERHLEDKVARYQQLAQRMAKGDTLSADQSLSLQKPSLLDSAESGSLTGSSNMYANGANSRNNNKNNSNINEEESTLSSDISRTISAMSDLINNRMSPVSEKTGRSQHVLLVKRYREILFDCSADFQKTSAAVARRREAMELFARKDGTTGGISGDGDLEMEQLLRERNSIGSSLRAATNVIGQAEEIRSDLRLQGSSLRGTHATVATIASNVPGLNYLIEGIRRKRSRDDMIVSGVIAMCILFTMWYVFGG